MEACKGMYQLSFQQPAPAKWLEQSARKAFDRKFTRLLLMVPWVSGACPGLCPGHVRDVRGMSGMSGVCLRCPGLCPVSAVPGCSPSSQLFLKKCMRHGS